MVFKRKAKNVLQRNFHQNFVPRRALYSGKKVLIVEDDLDLKPFICCALQEIDPYVRTTWKMGVKPALEAISKNTKRYGWKPFDLVIADVFLRGTETGMELWDRLRTHYGDVPTIVISAANEQTVMDMLDEFSSWPLFIQKPIDFEQFKHAVTFTMDLNNPDPPSYA